MLLDCYVYPACGTVDGYDQIGSSGFIVHLEQVFNDQLQEARDVALERLVPFLRSGGIECHQITHAMAP